MTSFNIRQTLILALLFFVTFQGWSWPWALVFAAWTCQSMATGTVYLLEPIHHKEHPVLFRLVAATWLGFCLLMALQDLAPSLISAG
jgi:Zn-dependent protease with chaperone function